MPGQGDMVSIKKEESASVIANGAGSVNVQSSSNSNGAAEDSTAENSESYHESNDVPDGNGSAHGNGNGYVNGHANGSGSDSARVSSIGSGQVLPEQPDLKIIRREINGFVGFANLPKQWHRKSIRRGFSLNLLCVSQRGLGKSTLINTLFNRNLDDGSKNKVEQKLEGLKIEGSSETEASRDDEEAQTAQESENVRSSVKIKTLSTTIEENGVSLKLSVVDTPGFGDAIDNSDSWRPIVDEVNYRFDQYLDAENKINRSSEDDNRIHACLYFIEPTAHYLKPLDLGFCKQIHEKCNLIPVIAKSDILTEEEIAVFKRRIRKQLEDGNVVLFEPPQYALDDQETIHASKSLYEKIPFAVVGSTDKVENSKGSLVRGRSYPWGIIEVDNASHCDFVYLRDLLISQYLEELRERTNSVLYEKYRSEKLTKLGIKQDNAVFKEFDPETKQKEEKQLHEAKLAKLEAEMKSVFHQKVSEKEKKLQKSEAELFARHKEMKEKLNKQLKALEEKKHQLEHSLNTPIPQSPAQPKKKGFLR